MSYSQKKNKNGKIPVHVIDYIPKGSNTHTTKKISLALGNKPGLYWKISYYNKSTFDSCDFVLTGRRAYRIK